MEEELLEAVSELSEAASAVDMSEATDMVVDDAAISSMASSVGDNVLNADNLARLNEILDGAAPTVGNAADLATPPVMNADVEAQLDAILEQRVEALAPQNPSLRTILTAARNQAARIGESITQYWDGLSRPTRFLIKNSGLLAVTFGIGYALERAMAKKAHDTGHRQSLSSYLAAGEANYKKLGLPYDRQVAATAALQYPWIDTTC